MDWFLYANRLHHERVKKKRHTQERNQESVSHLVLFLLLSSHLFHIGFAVEQEIVLTKNYFHKSFLKHPKSSTRFFYNQLHFGGKR